MKIMPFLKRQNSVFLTTLIGLILIGILICLPTGYEDALIYQGTERAVGKVVETDNSAIITSGLIQSGEQSCMLEIENGNFKGKILEGVNFLSGSLEKDKIFKEGDRALLTISCQGDTIRSVVISDHYRLDKEVILLAVFAVFLIIFAGKIGFQAILSFFITILMIWKILVPCYLKGYSPVWVGIGITVVLTAIIIFFVYGLDKRTLTAVSGALLGITTTCILGILFTGLFKIHGAVMTSSESLLYSGYQDLDLTSIFMASIFIGASGAMMDLAVDITSAVWEVIGKKPDISAPEAILSGLRVGRAAMGTMTTTLLLAYSGGYISLLMVFMAQGTPVDHILNYKYVAAEVLDTVVGSFGLVTVAPFTALMAGLLLTRRKKRRKAVSE
ncbi:YibE/F family protein [Eisenbergiella tayi]|uniref:YibE/F family protein n=1 Tax=Eisenbergiella tayi TaxID=1432052 RepID=UPI0009BD0936|nr:YibE/F family protein [Eisenbergiella tayi]